MLYIRLKLKSETDCYKIIGLSTIYLNVSRNMILLDTNNIVETKVLYYGRWNIDITKFSEFMVSEIELL